MRAETREPLRKIGSYYAEDMRAELDDSPGAEMGERRKSSSGEPAPRPSAR